MPTRRQFLISLTALSAGCADKSGDDSAEPGAPTRPPEPEPWTGVAAVDDALFPSGVQAGDALEESVLLSVRTAATALGLVLMRADGEVWVEDRVLESLEAADGGLQLAVDGLEADTAYAYAFTAEDAQSPVGRFRTALGPEGWRVVTFAATSCLGGNAPWPSMTAAAAERADFALLLGDTVYADGATSVEDYRHHWREAMSTAGLKDYTAATSVIAAWDDHEVGNNWSFDDGGDIEERFANGLAVFSESLPRRAGGGVAGIWRSLSWGAVLEVFVLDCRSEREGSDYISQEQLQFLLDGLSASAARFKIIATPVPFSDYESLIGGALSEDRWQGYPEQRTRITEHIRDEGITGVLFVAGDFHMGQVCRVDPAGSPGEGLYEVLAGPAGSFLNPVASLAETTEQWVSFVDQWNCVIFEADPDAGVIAVRFLGDGGDVLAQIDLNL